MEEPPTILIKVRRLHSQGPEQTYEVRCAPSTPIAELKRLLEDSTGVPVERQRLIYRGRVLKSTVGGAQQTVASYEARPSSYRRPVAVQTERGASFSPDT